MIPRYRGGGPGLRSSISRMEKGLFLVAVGLLVLGISGFIYDRAQRKTETPVSGGTYTEGVVADNPTKVERIVTRLTNIGLTFRDTDGSIKPALADSWEVTEEGKLYTFKIHPGYNAQGLLATIQSSKTDWKDIEITAPDDSTLQFRLKEPLSLFLSTTTNPIFPFGPYEIAKRDKGETILRSNTQFVLGEPFIPKFTIREFETQDDLMKAAKDGDIDGSADFKAAPNRLFTQYDIALPRYHVLLPNMTRSNLKKQEDRQRVFDKTDGGPVTYSLVTSSSEDMADLAETWRIESAAKNITMNLQKKQSLSLQKEDIPKREFDFLLYGINYGTDPDYYPFWHSSQVVAPGLNISGVKDKDLDALLEKARKEPSNEERKKLNKQIEDYLQSKYLQKVVDQEKFEFWVNKEIKGISYGTIEEGNDRFYLVWRWYIKSKLVK